MKPHEAQDSEKSPVEPGMEVEATQGDLGEADVSHPKVEKVVRDRQGRIARIFIRKGVLFRKELEVPAERIKQVESDGTSKHDGKVVVDMSIKEGDALTTQGKEKLTKAGDIMSQLEKEMPTSDGLRRQEQKKADRASQQDTEDTDAQTQHFAWWKMLGPGFLSGMAGNDASAVGSYSIDGARVGLGHLWLMLLATPLYQCVQYTCAKIGRLSNKGMSEILRENYGRPVAVLASLVLIIANLALISADLVAIGSGFELITGLSWQWFVLPAALFLWYVTVYQNFETIKKIFLVMSLAFVVYLITAIFSKPDASAVLWNTLVPHVDLNFNSVSSAVALLGATISPYTIYWQVQSEKEEKRPGNMKKQLRFAALDVGLGAISGNLIAYCIMITTATTLFAHHKSIQTVVDAASALEPLLGPFAKYLFAMGLIGAGLVAIPVLLASTSYGVTGTFGWPGALSKKPWQNEGFYLILTAALIASLILAFMRIDPISLIFWANVLNGVLTPILVVYLLILGNTKRVVKGQRLSWITNAGLGIAFLVMAAATVLLFYGLLTGSAGS